MVGLQSAAQALGPRPQGRVKCPSYNPYVKALADRYVADYHADSTRIYIFGASMGGDGVWHIVNDNPHYFAAAMAASGGYRGMGVPELGCTPLLCTKGSREANYDTYVQMINDIKLVGGNVNFQPLDAAITVRLSSTRSPASALPGSCPMSVNQ